MGGERVVGLLHPAAPCTAALDPPALLMLPQQQALRLPPCSSALLARLQLAPLASLCPASSGLPLHSLRSPASGPAPAAPIEFLPSSMWRNTFSALFEAPPLPRHHNAPQEPAPVPLPPHHVACDAFGMRLTRLLTRLLTSRGTCSHLCPCLCPCHSQRRTMYLALRAGTGSA